MAGHRALGAPASCTRHREHEAISVALASAKAPLHGSSGRCALGIGMGCKALATKLTARDRRGTRRGDSCKGSLRTCSKSQRTSRASTSVTWAAPGRMPPRCCAAGSSTTPSPDPGAPGAPRWPPADQRCVERKAVLKPVRGSMRMTQGVTGLPVSRAQPARKAHTSASTSTAASRLKKSTTPMANTTTRSTRRNRPATISFNSHLSFTTWAGAAPASARVCTPAGALQVNPAARR